MRTKTEPSLEKLRGGYVEWSETARVVIKRRDYLIHLGLAKRKAPKRGSAPSQTSANGS